MFDWRDAQVSTFLRLNNLFDHSYVGSVIVNESNGRYYEPAPDRTHLRRRADQLEIGRVRHQRVFWFTRPRVVGGKV